MKNRRCPSSSLKPIFVFSILAFTFFLTQDKPSDYDRKEKEKIAREQEIERELRPWYFEGGSIRPRIHDENLKLWPDETGGDRILNQLMFIPEDGPRITKKIFLEKLSDFDIEISSRIFDNLNCPVKDCEIVSDATTADAVIFNNFVTRTRQKSAINQTWILYLLESPIYSGKVIQQKSVNWTASYRLDSDLVTPYDKWVYYNESNKSGELAKNYAEGKTKKVAWFVSNCNSRNKRLAYAKELRKYISVDIFGSCGSLSCPKFLEDSCRQMVSRNYKFYLSFENANCRDYITEKFYSNGLRLDVVPIAMGAPKEDYEKVAPLNSFIHVEDFPSPRHLAEYLHFLDENDDVYNSYFSWKSTGEFINTYFFCRLCGLLHARRPDRYYRKVTRWWRKSGTCTKTFWNKKSGKQILKSLTGRRGKEVIEASGREGRFPKSIETHRN